MANSDANHATPEGRRPQEGLIPKANLAKLLRIGPTSRFFKTINDLAQEGGYPRSALALIVEKCEDYLTPWRHEFVTLADISRTTGQAPMNIGFVFGNHGVKPDQVVRRTRLYAKARLPALLEMLDQLRRQHPDFLSAKALAKHLGASQMTVLAAINNEILIPDRVNADGAHQFRRDRLPEIEKLWKNRLEAYPAWASVKAVITPYGMMRPRAAPRGEVFAPEMLQRPEPTSRGSFSNRKVFYNLNDLTASPSDAPSKTIFKSTSLKSVRTRIGSKSRRRI